MIDNPNTIFSFADLYKTVEQIDTILSRTKSKEETQLFEMLQAETFDAILIKLFRGDKE